MRSVLDLLVAHEGGIALRCPVCGELNSHIQRVFARRGLDDSCVLEEVYEGVRTWGMSNSRDSALVIVFLCEEEHYFDLVIQQHKGPNFICTFPQPRERFDDEATPPV